MKKRDKGQMIRRMAKITASRPRVTDDRKVPPAVKRPVHPLTLQEKAAWLWYWWGSEPKLPMEEADFRLARPGEKNLVLNINKLPRIWHPPGGSG